MYQPLGTLLAFGLGDKVPPYDLIDEDVESVLYSCEYCNFIRVLESFT